MEKPIQKILVPTDLSRSQDALTRYAIQLAEQLGAELLFFAVLDSSAQLNLIGSYSTGLEEGEGAGAAVAQSGEGFRTNIIEDAKRRLQKLVDEAMENDVRAYGHAILSEQAKAEILREARESKVDLILLGIDEYPLLWKLIFGEAYDTLLHGAPCPVLTCRTKIMRNGGEPRSEDGE